MKNINWKNKIKNHSQRLYTPRIRIISIWNKMESLHFMIQIKYHRSNSVQTATSFKILNDKAVYISLDLWNKILTMKWTNGEIFKWRGSLSTSPACHQLHIIFIFLFFNSGFSIHHLQVRQNGNMNKKLKTKSPFGWIENIEKIKEMRENEVFSTVWLKREKWAKFVKKCFFLFIYLFYVFELNMTLLMFIWKMDWLKIFFLKYDFSHESRIWEKRLLIVFLWKSSFRCFFSNFRKF